MKYETVIGILTVSRFDLLTECVNSVVTNTPGLSKIPVIIANNSTDREYIEKVDRLADAHGFTTLNHRRGRGTSAAWNAMSRVYDCEKVAIISDDVIVHEGWKQGMDWILSFPHVGVAGIRIWNGWHEWDKRNSIPFSEVSNKIDATDAIYPCGCLLMYNRPVFDEVSGFDENLWMGLEEVTFSLDLMKLGYANYQVGIRGDIYKFGNHFGSASGYSPGNAAPELQEIAAKEIEYFQGKHQTQWPLTEEYQQHIRILQRAKARERELR